MARFGRYLFRCQNLMLTVCKYILSQSAHHNKVTVCARAMEIKKQYEMYNVVDCTNNNLKCITLNNCFQSS